MKPPISRIIHLHIPKTAGTALRAAFEAAYGDSFRSFPHRDENLYKEVNPEEFDFYSGHFGFKTASAIGGDIITVFRNPVDRFISVYYFWRQLYANGVERSRNTTLATKYSIDEFVLIRDEPFLLQEFFNRVTWQVAYGGSLIHRQELRQEGVSEDEVFQLALRNVETFAVVGLQERMNEFAANLRSKFGVELKIQKTNVTENKVDKKDLRVQTLRQIQEWVYMDLELYQHVLGLV